MLIVAIMYSLGNNDRKKGLYMFVTDIIFASEKFWSAVGWIQRWGIHGTETMNMKGQLYIPSPGRKWFSQLVTKGRDTSKA